MLALLLAALPDWFGGFDPLRGSPRLFDASSPWIAALLVAALVLLAVIVPRLAPRKRRRIRRATILLIFYLTTWALAWMFARLHNDDWAGRVGFLASLFEALVVIDLVAIFVFDVLLLALRIEVADIVHDLARGTAWLLAFLGILHRAGVHLEGLVATSAVLTVVLGLSLQATLGNVLGGVALQLDDSLHVGDWIQLASGQQGKITAIRWRHTTLETRNWDTIIVPNSSLLADNITILGQRHDQPVQHRSWVYFNVDFRYSPDEVITVVEDALQSTPIQNVAAFPPPNCVCIDFAKPGEPSYAQYAVRYWLTELANDDATSSAVRVRVYVALKRAGIPMAVPGQTLWLSMDDPAHKQRKLDREMEYRVGTLQQVEMFAGLGPDEARELAEGMRPAPYSRGEVITRQDAAAHWLYVLARGEVEVRVRAEPGVDRLVTRLSAPTVFGELGMMTGERRASTVVAATEVDCYRIDKEVLRHAMQRRPEMMERISQVLARRRIELQAAREGLDAETKKERIHEEKGRLLQTIRAFFGLDEDEPAEPGADPR